MSFQQDPQALLRQANQLFQPFQKSTKESGSWNPLSAARDVGTKIYNKVVSGTNPEENAEQAGDLYHKAATAFQNRKQGLESAHAFRCAGDAYARAGEFKSRDASENYMSAWEQYMKTTNREEGYRCAEKAIEYHRAVGNFTNAGSLEQQVAQFLEKENNAAKLQNSQPPHELWRIQQAYQRAGELMDMTSKGKSRSRAPRLKAAEYAALIGDLSNAADIIDEIIREMSVGQENLILPLHTPLAAAIHLAIGDMVAFERAMDFIYQVDSSFTTNSRKGQMFPKFAHLLQEGDEAGFRKLIAESKDFSLFTEPTQNVLNMIASSIQNKIDEEDFS